MELIPQSIPEVKLLVPKVHRDARGFLLERWRADVPGLPTTWAQDNHSRSGRSTLRGLHYQLGEHVQTKLVGVTRGRILDVAVDLRRGSPTFGRWTSAVLDDENLHQLLVPRGFAHGFLVLSEVADVLYRIDHPYTPSAERGVRWDDPELAIDWSTGGEAGDAESGSPEVAAYLTPLISPKDAALPTLAEAEFDFEYGPL